ncbi:MAG: hypothetical protein NTV79_08840, partial [Candidatus Aureabacteria bacterium]|nr:hypothetical protein [Candidatus Auribacterota bacterium]
ISWKPWDLPFKVDGLVKSQKVAFSVIPAKAGIQIFQVVLDPTFRRGDDPRDFLRDHQGFSRGKIVILSSPRGKAT